MARSYQHISNYEKEILELKSQGMTMREIGEKFGFTYKQVHNFITRYNAKQRKIKRLEMENELMRDFLSLTERK